MNRQPNEILEEIIAHIPTHLLYNKCLIGRTWYKLVRSELYRRWKDCELEYQKRCQIYEDNIKEWRETYSELSTDTHDNWNLEIYSEDDEYRLQEIADEQIEIEENMLKYGMIVDEEEKKKVEYDVKEGKYSSDPWGIIEELWCSEMIHIDSL